MEGREPVDILGLFKKSNLLKACAPMVRYSKLEFRTLVKKYGCELCFTPMIMADSFVQSLKARNNEFTTNGGDVPLIVQFAANSVDDFVRASELVSPFCDGVDLNCGCPQRWAMSEGYGAELLSQPQLVKEMVSRLRNISANTFSVSVKMRLKNDIRDSVELCRRLESAGATFLTVHGRTPAERTEPVHYDQIRTLVQSVRVPVIANGDVKSLSDAREMQELTNCQGVMSARGILHNPALYSGVAVTPLSCIQDWIDICLSSNIQFQCFHHHLVFMLEKRLNRRQRNSFNGLKSFEKVIEFLKNHLDIDCCEIERTRSSNVVIEYGDEKNGSYFNSKIKSDNNDSIEEYVGDFSTIMDSG